MPRSRIPFLACLLLLLATTAVTAQSRNHDPGDPIDCTGNTCTNGPDVTVYDVRNTNKYDGDGAGGMIGFSIGTDSCNVGDTPSNWCDENGGCSGTGVHLDGNQYPVISGNLYRVRQNGRFEQLGKSWLKHGFLSTNSFNSACGDNSNSTNPPSCRNEPIPLGGSQLGVGCTDYYGPGLNGSRPLGMRAEIQPTTGFLPLSTTLIGGSGSDQQIRLAETEIDPANPDNNGARYFFDAQYIVDDDAAAVTDGVSNAFNNASYREALVSGSLAGGTLDLNFTGSTVRERSAMYAWQEVFPDVEIVNADFVGPDGIQERFEVGRRITFAGGVYTTVIAVRNMNSELAARSFSVLFRSRGAAGDGISDVEFHDVDSHSGEFVPGCGTPPCVIDGTDWASTIESNSVTWATAPYDPQDPTANALRWGTAFTFKFNSTTDPTLASYEIGLYKPGPPSSVSVPFNGVSPVVFGDGFESGDVSAWSSSSP